MPSSRLLLKGGRVLDLDRDPHHPAVADVLIVDGKIAAIGVVPDEPDAPPPETIDLGGKLVVPGFVNAHYHSHDIFLKGCFDPSVLEFWALNALPRAYPPGEVWHYNTGETNLIGVLVSSATGKSLSAYLQEKVWQPAGMEAEATWLLGKTGLELGGCCLQAATRDYARFGLFVLIGGKGRDGRQIVPSDWFAQATTKQRDIGRAGRGYGFQWWTNDDGTFAAQGIFGQGIFIDPKRQLVIVFNADWPSAQDARAAAERESFFRAVQQAIDAEAAPQRQ